jgi:hypothetical protein
MSNKFGHLVFFAEMVPYFLAGSRFSGRGAVECGHDEGTTRAAGGAAERTTGVAGGGADGTSTGGGGQGRS